MSPRTIQFTQEQARELTCVTPGDVRAWRKAVPYLASKPGKAARFSFADLVGLAITGDLTNRFGVRISDVGAGVDRLFRALADARPAHLEGVVAIVGTGTGRLLPIGDLTYRHVPEPLLVVPCDPVIALIGERMMPLVPGSAQSALPFPPHALKAGQ